MKKWIYVSLALLVCALNRCSPSLYMPQSADAAQQEKLLQGRKLYVARCNGCHNLYLPSQFTADKWQKNLDEMQENAKITQEEKELIYNYLISQP